MNSIEAIVKAQMSHTIKETDFSIGKKYRGKVRDVYDLEDKLLLITSDRISAFDRVLGVVPFKGEILNSLSLFWFDKTKDIIPNHIISAIHPNAIVVKKCEIVPIEVIVRGYLTGGGWREYEKTGKISGIELPANLKKNAKFKTPIITPTTKAQEGHDMPISREEIIAQKIIDPELYTTIEKKALALFQRGTEIAAKNNMILVDTKYEFGTLPDGTLIVADEIHTSDSSRYWFLDSYEELFQKGEEQKMLDKEYLRKWLLSIGYQGDGDPPVLPDEIIAGLVSRYKTAYETITGEQYELIEKDAIKLLIEAIAGLK